MAAFLSQVQGICRVDNTVGSLLFPPMQGTMVQGPSTEDPDAPPSSIPSYLDQAEPCHSVGHGPLRPVVILVEASADDTGS